MRVFWEVYTGGDLCLCRAPVGLTEETHPAHEELRSHVGATCDEWFTHAARDLAEKTATRGDDPLWWLPP